MSNKADDQKKYRNDVLIVVLSQQRENNYTGTFLKINCDKIKILVKAVYKENMIM